MHAEKRAGGPLQENNELRFKEISYNHDADDWDLKNEDLELIRDEYRR